jgi:hypothetical protein
MRKQGCRLAQNRAGSVRMGGRSQQEQLSSRQFLRLRARRGPKRAMVAVAASILTAVYCVLRDQMPYRDLGASYFARIDQVEPPNAWCAESKSSAIRWRSAKLLKFPRSRLRSNATTRQVRKKMVYLARVPAGGQGVRSTS